MLIDWFTVCAQGLNFLILVWLLKRFLYKPILAAIADREKRVAADVAEAEANRARALTERDDWAKKVAAFDADTAARLAQAALEAGKEQERLLQAARTAAADLRRDDASALRGAVDRLGKEVALLAAQEVGQIARQALQELAGADLEQRMLGEFLRRLSGLGPDLRSTLAGALRFPGAVALIRSAHELPGPARAGIGDGLNRALAAEVPVRFEADPRVVCGIEMDLGGQRVGWSVAEYLRGLERATTELISAASSPPPGPGEAVAPAASL
jgi:F-type H+-transporting ATPase subunit b